MLTGYNNNVTYQGEVFHVQTEEGGIDSPFVTTLLYRGGAILASKRTTYRELMTKPDFKTELRQIMDRQHRTVIKALLAGRFDDMVHGRIADTAPPTGTTEPAKPAEPAGKPAAPASSEPATTEPAPSEPATAESADQRGKEAPKNLDDILLDFIAETGETKS